MMTNGEIAVRIYEVIRAVNNTLPDGVPDTTCSADCEGSHEALYMLWRIIEQIAANDLEVQDADCDD